MDNNFCYMCRNVRPPVQSYNEQLIGDAHEGAEGMDLMDDRDDASMNEVDEFANSIASSMVLGAGIGAGLAWLNRSDISSGAMAGAGIGALGDVALWEFAAAERRRAQQQLRERARAPAMSPAGRFVPPRGASVISLVDDEDSPGTTAGSGASRRSGSIGSSSNINNHSMNNRNNNSNGRPMPPINVEALLMQALASSMVARNGVGTAGVGMRRGVRGGGGRGGGLMDMAMNFDFDNLSYEALLERFPAPPRGVDAATLEALPVRTYTEPASAPSADNAGNTSSSSSSSSSSSAPTAAANDDAMRSCSICLEEYTRGDTVRTLPCLHCFHAPCVDHWLREHNTCPVCKHSLT
eukprot:CAMPEP_0184983162 /NCGR_PEP_ID=MMETSP1098-20130426/12483_1 /TAXON_ID=89044 /ORGANISM="Spumella elongata, Strain CCAP 955/1" /LENGTH=351 /DNA_ID=CAMNT_0027506967 /DNA_START=493 /DNA_END=1548 /DNA_ORIENTATION=+